MHVSQQPVILATVELCMREVSEKAEAILALLLPPPPIRRWDERFRGLRGGRGDYKENSGGTRREKEDGRWRE
jgi:hypothetical protein